MSRNCPQTHKAQSASNAAVCYGKKSSAGSGQNRNHAREGIPSPVQGPPIVRRMSARCPPIVQPLLLLLLHLQRLVRANSRPDMIGNSFLDTQRPAAKLKGL